MKKISILFFFTLITFLCSAQFSSPISLGVHAGLVSTKTNTDFYSSSQIKEQSENGMMIGVFARININKWYIQPELNYVRRKSSVQFGSTGNHVLRTNSLDIPILLGYKIVKVPFFKLRVFAGPVTSFIINENFKKTFENNVVDDKMKSAVWNAKFGAGIDVWKLTLDVDYETGLTKIVKDINNNMINVTLGFRFF